MRKTAFSSPWSAATWLSCSGRRRTEAVNWPLPSRSARRSISPPMRLRTPSWRLTASGWPSLMLPFSWTGGAARQIFPCRCSRSRALSMKVFTEAASASGFPPAPCGRTFPSASAGKPIPEPSRPRAAGRRRGAVLCHVRIGRTLPRSKSSMATWIFTRPGASPRMRSTRRLTAAMPS